MLLVACPLTAAVAQPTRCDTLPAYQREFARAIGACRDLALIIASLALETQCHCLPRRCRVIVLAAMPRTASPVSPQAKKRSRQRAEARKSTSKAAAASAKSVAPSKNRCEPEKGRRRRNEPVVTMQAAGRPTRTNRYAFRYPAELATALHRNCVVEWHLLHAALSVCARSRELVVQLEEGDGLLAWQQRLKEHCRERHLQKERAMDGSW